MKTIVLAASLSLMAGVAVAQPQAGGYIPTTTTLCLDVNGELLPSACKVPASRLDPREDVCLCARGQQVTAPICGPGEHPPAESAAFEHARYAAIHDGSLVGALWQGKPMCVAPRFSRDR